MAEINRDMLMKEGLFGAKKIEEKPKPVEIEDIRVPIDRMLDFHTRVIVDGRVHPYTRSPRAKIEELAESIAENGMQHPIRMRKDLEKSGYYEIIEGHNRRDACKLLGKEELSTKDGEIRIVDMDDQEAVSIMFATNIQREGMPTMDKAWAYRIWMENNKQKVGRKKMSQNETQNADGENMSQNETQNRSDQRLAVETGDSRAKIQRLIRLTYLIEGLQNSIDLNVLQDNAGYEISFMGTAQQEEVLKYISQNKRISVRQAQVLREKAKAQFLSAEQIDDLIALDAPKNPMKSIFKQTERRFKKYDKEKLSRVDSEVLESLIADVIDRYLDQI